MDILKKSIRKMKKKNFLYQKQWNHYAKEHELFTAQTVMRITGKSYKELRTR